LLSFLSQVAPGPEVYQGEHKAVEGPAPVVKETGKGTGASAAAVAGFDGIFHSIVSGVNEALPGGGGYKTPVDGNPGLSQPVNGGKSTAPVGNLFKGGLLPTGVIPGVGYVGAGGSPPKGAVQPQGATPPSPPKLRIRGRPVYRG
jgi:hypothetical protein